VGLPYSDSKANPVQAQGRIRQMLLKFGVDRLRFDEDMQKHEIKVEFIYKGYPVTMPILVDQLAERYLKDEPWNARRHMNRSQWEASKRRIAQNASFSLLEDFLKGLIMIVEMGVFSFEEIFFSYFIDKQGRRFGEVFAKQLPDILSGKLALPEGDK